MYQIVYATEEADDAHEFITNLPSDMKPKLNALKSSDGDVLQRDVAIEQSFGGDDALNCSSNLKKGQKEMTTKFGKTHVALFYKAWKGGTRKCYLLSSKDSNVSGFSYRIYAIVLKTVCRMAVRRSTLARVKGE
uniref:Uncharacterized protein n=1 Tax=Vespula pensylvanica TaxID=30213 RepID=A0A834JKV8_VESPE|nr:hypothetical protein H0235_017590 [Vespula pensylvanica]